MSIEICVETQARWIESVVQRAKVAQSFQSSDQVEESRDKPANSQDEEWVSSVTAEAGLVISRAMSSLNSVGRSSRVTRVVGRTSPLPWSHR